MRITPKKIEATMKATEEKHADLTTREELEKLQEQINAMHEKLAAIQGVTITGHVKRKGW